MFVSSTRLPHLLSPSRYFDEVAYREEAASVLKSGWHVVGTTDELAVPGAFITVDLFGTPVHVRNFDGELSALSNVCAHRHALISSKRCGKSTAMQCQYHGWQYQKDGSTGRIPQPKNFVPFDDPRPCLPRFAVETVGQLVFVSVASAPRTLKDFLGADFYQLLSERFDERWTLSLKWNPEYAVNWKIPLENSLEAYHVPNVHPHTFRDDPGEAKSEHVLLSNRTAFGTTLPFSAHSRLDEMFQRMGGRVAKYLGHDVTNGYWQHHVFPNLLFSFTDSISLCNCIIPSGATTCSATVRQFGRLDARGRAVRNGLGRAWSKLNAVITKRILIEDLQIFESIQAGMRASEQPGVLGRCEERIHRFQEYLVDGVGQGLSDNSSQCSSPSPSSSSSSSHSANPLSNPSLNPSSSEFVQ